MDMKAFKLNQLNSGNFKMKSSKYNRKKQHSLQSKVQSNYKNNDRNT